MPCKLQGQGFNSAFTTPAVVIAPEIGAKAQVASVTCSYNEEAKTKVLEPYNKTVADINANANAAAVNHGLLGALVGSIAAGVQTSRRDPSKDIYAYHSSSVVFADN
ncbi:hypothetical protein RA19_04160 [Leisingera sp. ANG-M1]|nr:hypothetical protein RA19_04160 [Leisingera sp. ANG-M1]